MKKQEMLDAIRKRNELTGRRNLFARFGCHKSENGYELCQAFNADGKEVWIERDNWRGMIGTWATCGGFKVEDNVLYAWIPPFDAIWESADSWEERVQFENQNILLCA